MVKPLEEHATKCECHDCGLEYGSTCWADVVVPDEFWAKINPSNHKDGGLLCFNCMVGRFGALGLDNVPFQVTSGPFSFAIRGPQPQQGS